MGKTYRKRDVVPDREAIQRAAFLTAIGATTPDQFCIGKTPYSNRNDATAEAKRITQRRGRPFHSYKCPRCPFYHLAHTRGA